MFDGWWLGQVAVRENKGISNVDLHDGVGIRIGYGRLGDVQCPEGHVEDIRSALDDASSVGDIRYPVDEGGRQDPERIDLVDPGIRTRDGSQDLKDKGKRVSLVKSHSYNR